MKKIIRLSTIPTSLNTFMRGQLKMLNQHYEMIVVSSPGKELEEMKEREGVRGVAVPIKRQISPLNDLISLLRLIYLFAKERPYVVHSMTPKAGLLSMIAAFVTRVPVRIHTFTGLIFPTKQGKTKRLLMLMDKITCFCATYINPEGNGVKKDLMAYGITSKPLHIIANGNVRGVDMSYYDRTQEVISQAKEIRKEGIFTFIFIGRIVRDKGIHELVRAFHKLGRIHSHVRLFLIGRQESELDPIDEDVKELMSNDSKIVFLGRKADVRPYLTASDAFVFPSYREGMPNSLLEAGAMGLASIVTDINGSNEIIIDGRNGKIIPPMDTEALFAMMDYFVRNKNKVQSMAEHAREMIAERYEQQIIWKALLSEYNRLTNK